MFNIMFNKKKLKMREDGEAFATFKGRPFFKHNWIGRETIGQQEEIRTKGLVCSAFVQGCNYSVVCGENNGTLSQINPVPFLCAGRSCCSQAGLLGSTFAGVHKFLTPVFLEACHQGTKQKLLPAGISLRKGVQGLQSRSGAGGQEEMCCSTGALLRAQGPRVELGSNPSLPFSWDL